MRRRDVLALGGSLAASSLLGRAAAAADTLLQYVGRPEDLGTPTEYFDRLITPTAVFFVRSHFGAPALRARKLRIGGLVDRPLELSVEELRRFEEVTVTSVLQCAGNGRALSSPRVPGVQWVHGAMGQATWTGVRLADVLAKAGVQAGAAHVQLTGDDVPPKPTVPRFTRGIHVERALDPGTLLVHRMNGAPLTLAHGAPLRLVVPGWTGNHWVKWLSEITVQKQPVGGFYMETAYRWPKQPIAPGTTLTPDQTQPVTVFPVKSLIARPLDGARAPAGRQEVVGVAFSGAAAIRRVEVSTDGGASWREAALEGEAGAGRWQLYRFAFTASPGPCRAMARATDGAGVTQPERAQWNPSGYLWNAWHSVAWTAVA
jgi:DMSO/TMAO reductase YedYZ molybdopterin-dependent catalytic subunit